MQYVIDVNSDLQKFLKQRKYTAVSKMEVNLQGIISWLDNPYNLNLSNNKE